MSWESKEKREKKQAIDFKYNLRLYYGLLKNYKWLIFGLLVLILFHQSTHIVDKYLFKVIIDKGAEFVNGSLGREAYTKVLMLVGGVFLLMILATSITRWFYISFINRLDSHLMLDVKKMFFNHLMGLSHEFHNSNKTGSLISKLIRSSSAVERMTDTFVFSFAPLFFQSIVAIASLFIFNKMAAFTVIGIIVVFIWFSLWINKKQQAPNMAANEAEDLEKGHISDFFTNVDSIKYFGKEEIVKARYLGVGEATRSALLRHWDYFRGLSSGQNFILGIGTFLVILFPILQLLKSELSIGSLVFIYTVYGQLFVYLFSFDHGIRNYYRSMADFESLFQYYKIQNEVKDKPGAKELMIGLGVIEFKNINFSYKKRKIFSGFSLKIPRNKKVALVGPSGSGKTTLVKLLYRLYDLEGGEILIDKKNIAGYKQESLRGELSIVPQECVLFDDTIYNNIIFSNPRASRQEVEDAIRFAQLDKAIEGMPNKENTIVGERGVKLSGGEKQRVSIARAILANKKVLVFDEATSSLDSGTEHEIQKDLQRLMKGRTSIIIAHRLSTIMSADMIVVMDKGVIMQQGTHKELIRQEGMYKKLWNLQKGGYIK